jgi:hypothetical protein
MILYKYKYIINNLYITYVNSTTKYSNLERNMKLSNLLNLSRTAVTSKANYIITHKSDFVHFFPFKVYFEKWLP